MFEGKGEISGNMLEIKVRLVGTEGFLRTSYSNRMNGAYLFKSNRSSTPILVFFHSAIYIT